MKHTSSTEPIYHLRFSRPGRYWFVADDEFWCWDRNIETDYYNGETRTFRIGEGEGAFVSVKGPIRKTKEEFEKEAGEKYESTV